MGKKRTKNNGEGGEKKGEEAATKKKIISRHHQEWGTVKKGLGTTKGGVPKEDRVKQDKVEGTRSRSKKLGTETFTEGERNRVKRLSTCAFAFGEKKWDQMWTKRENQGSSFAGGNRRTDQDSKECQ